jgi:hypothetical protein
MFGGRPKSPLANHMGFGFGSGRPKRRRALIGLTFLLIAPYIGSTLAASFTINTGKSLEFGQGSQSAIACDQSIATAISESWHNSGPFFRVTTISLTNLNNTDNTSSPVQDGGCGHKKLKVQLLDSGGSALTIGTSSTTSVTMYVPTANGSVTDGQDGSVLNGNTAALGSSGTTSTLTITIPSSTAVNAGNVSRILIESVD